jgi:hypothetical protein
MEEYTEVDISNGPIMQPSMMLADLKSRNEGNMIRGTHKASENITFHSIRGSANIRASDENINDTWRGDTISTPKLVINNSKSINNKKLTLLIPEEEDEEPGVNISGEGEHSRNASLFSPNRGNIQTNS